MRQKDIAVLVGVGLLSALISALVAGAVFTPPKSRSTKVPVVAPITSTFPDIRNNNDYKQFFNGSALDPTQLIKINPSQNAQPFSTGNQ